jgi:hypothetical protein
MLPQDARPVVMLEVKSNVKLYVARRYSHLQLTIEARILELGRPCEI